MFCTIIDLLFVFGVDVGELLAKYGAWAYAIMFLIIFCETGFVITPVLPGDSMIWGRKCMKGITGLLTGTG